jgi:transcription elongation factor Elf1
MKCPKCNHKLKSITTIDDHWKVYKKCKCGYEQFGLVGKRIS